MPSLHQRSGDGFDKASRIGEYDQRLKPPLMGLQPSIHLRGRVCPRRWTASFSSSGAVSTAKVIHRNAHGTDIADARHPAGHTVGVCISAHAGPLDTLARLGYTYGGGLSAAASVLLLSQPLQRPWPRPARPPMMRTTCAVRRPGRCWSLANKKNPSPWPIFLCAAGSQEDHCIAADGILDISTSSRYSSSSNQEV
jgi:hypothetical protein